MIFPAKAVLYRSKLSPIVQRMIFLDVLQWVSVPTEDEELAAVDTATIWVAELLYQLPFISEIVLQIVLEGLRPSLATEADAYWSAVKGGIARQHPSSNHQIVFADGLWSTWTGRKGFLNLIDGSICDKLPHVPLETLSYNLTELLRQQRKRCTMLMEAARGGEHDAPDATESRDRTPSVD